MDIKIKMEEPMCANETLTEVKAECEEPGDFHSETVFVFSHFVKDCINDGEVDSNETCNKIEIKEEPCWSKITFNEMKQEVQLPSATDDLQKERKETGSYTEVVTGDVIAEEAYRLHTETGNIFFSSTDSAEIGWIHINHDIVKPSQQLSSSQPQVLQDLETSYVLDSGANDRSFIQNLQAPYKCKLCGKIFTFLPEFKSHSVSHNNKKSFNCEVCKRSFNTASYLRKHKLSHEGKSPYTCEICSKSFVISSHLKRHKLAHEGKKPYTCEICNKNFAVASYLKQHSLIHKAKKSHTCELCNKSFTLPRHLKRHKFVHEGKRPFTCEICHKGFIHASHVKVHRVIHEGKKPYKCDICHKRFSQVSHLKPHKLTHEGKRPFVCEICNKGFTRISNLKRHMLIRCGKMAKPQ